MAENKFTPQHVEGNQAQPRMSAETPADNLKDKTEALIDAEALNKQAEFIPSPEDQIDALGIPEWRTLEKKIVRRLDMTLMPCKSPLEFSDDMRIKPANDTFIQVYGSCIYSTIWTEPRLHKHASTPSKKILIWMRTKTTIKQQ